MNVRFLGQSCFKLTDGTVTVLTDPFLTGNPKAAVAAAEVSPDVILLTHGHATQKDPNLLTAELAR